MLIMTKGIARWRLCKKATAKEVAQDGGHTPAYRLGGTCNLGQKLRSLILDVHVMVNWHLSKQGIR